MFKWTNKQNYFFIIAKKSTLSFLLSKLNFRINSKHVLKMSNNIEMLQIISHIFKAQHHEKKVRIRVFSNDYSWYMLRKNLPKQCKMIPLF